MRKITLYEQIIAPENIYKAIYSLESYIFEKYLLKKIDYNDYLRLHDKFDDRFINSYIRKCVKRIDYILNSDELFDCDIYLKAKKFNQATENVEFRPIHTSSLLDQICMVAMLSVLMFDDSSGTRRLSAISRLLPANFYGNIPSKNVSELFKPWNKQYKEYSTNAIAANRTYYETKKYKYELILDLERFFPSINPIFIYNYIKEKWPVNASPEDKKWVAIILEKLLFFNLTLEENVKYFYYPDGIKSLKRLKYNIGIAQGLPQAYFFGNICMSLIAKHEKKLLNGDSFYYVDDSIIYTNVEVKQESIEKLGMQINSEVNKYLDAESLRNRNLKLFHKKVEDKYKLTIHPLGGKSEFRKIEKIDSLYFLARPASPLPFEIRTAQDEFEDNTLLEKIQSLLDAIDYLIEEARSKKNDTELKRLYRFRKFYLNRRNYLILSQTADILYDNNEIDMFVEKFNLKVTPSKSDFFDLLESDVFCFESQAIAEQISNEKELRDKFLNTVKAFEMSCLGNDHKSSEDTQLYFSKILSTIYSMDSKSLEKYISLKNNKHIKGISSHKRLTRDNKIENIKKIIDSIN